MKMEFKDELSISSNTARHCTTWALSDPTTSEFEKSCDHTHNEFCPEVWLCHALMVLLYITFKCELRANSLAKYKDLVEKLFPGDSFEDREMRFDMNDQVNSIKVGHH